MCYDTNTMENENLFRNRENSNFVADNSVDSATYFLSLTREERICRQTILLANGKLTRIWQEIFLLLALSKKVVLDNAIEKRLPCLK